jgi:hypothetical protein
MTGEKSMAYINTDGTVKDDMPKYEGEEPGHCAVSSGSALWLKTAGMHENRKVAAEKWLKFWMNQWAEYGDGCARVQMDRAHETLGDVYQYRNQQNGASEQWYGRHAGSNKPQIPLEEIPATPYLPNTAYEPTRQKTTDSK